MGGHVYHHSARVSGLSRAERRRYKDLFEAFAARVEVVGLAASQQELLSHIVELRRARKLKLPDAIIAGTARYQRATLLTGDRHFGDVPGLNVLEP